MAARFKPGDRLRVIDLDDLTCAPGRKAPFAAGSEVVCQRVHPQGRSLILAGVHGWWKARRFEAAS